MLARVRTYQLNKIKHKDKVSIATYHGEKRCEGASLTRARTQIGKSSDYNTGKQPDGSLGLR
jgi:hypothetical protein